MSADIIIAHLVLRWDSINVNCCQENHCISYFTRSGLIYGAGPKTGFLSRNLLSGADTLIWTHSIEE